VYSTVNDSKSADDMILIETNRERSIQKACESLAARMIEKICSCFPAYEGSGIHLNPQLEAVKLGADFDGEIPNEESCYCKLLEESSSVASSNYCIHFKAENSNF
jgi:hypothetical protein